MLVSMLDVRQSAPEKNATPTPGLRTSNAHSSYPKKPPLFMAFAVQPRLMRLFRPSPYLEGTFLFMDFPGMAAGSVQASLQGALSESFGSMLAGAVPTV